MSENIIKQPRWKTCEYTQRQVNDAGKVVCLEEATLEEKEHAVEIIDNWRAAHAYPLQIFYMHLHRITKGTDDVIVVQRLKRLDSILKKIERNPKMNLWRMQDLGGCRVIVSNVDSVHHILARLDAIRFAIENGDMRKIGKGGYFLLKLNYETNELKINSYKPSEVDDANKDYTTIESLKNPVVDAVLVRAESFSTLKSAYPNYFGDISEFINIMRTYIE